MVFGVLIPERMRRLVEMTLLRVVAPLAISIPIVFGIVHLTGADALRSTEVALRNLALPPMVVLVLWNAFAVIGRAFIEREGERRKADDGT